MRNVLVAVKAAVGNNNDFSEIELVYAFSGPGATSSDLCHTNASLLIAEGVEMQTAAKRLEHSKATTTTRK